MHDPAVPSAKTAPAFRWEWHLLESISRIGSSVGPVKNLTMNALVLQQICVSLGIGLLLGLQRERTERSIGGIRTFPFISLLGTVCAMIGATNGTWIVPAGLLALAALVMTVNLAKNPDADGGMGLTTEIAALLLYVVGVLIVVVDMALAAVLGGSMALLLHFKAPLHRFAQAIGERDMHAIIQFVLISLVILPVLPNTGYGPYGVLNPFKIWLMVVLIVGLGLSGYVAYKVFGARAGTILGGIIGGLISSTATTVTFARKSAGEQSLAPLAALVIMIASCISLVRVLIEIGVAAPRSFAALAPPLGVMLAACCAIAGGLYFMSRTDDSEMPEQKNPAEFKPAFIFAALYALVLMGVAYSKDQFGERGLYVVAALSGLTDMDAITLSTSQLAERGEVAHPAAWRAILTAAMANFIFKFGVVASLGSRPLVLRVGASFALALLAGGAILWLWPGKSDPGDSQKRISATSAEMRSVEP